VAAIGIIGALLIRTPAATATPAEAKADQPVAP
jgi:hypothetical protein